MLEQGDMMSPNDRELLKELKTGQTFCLKVSTIQGVLYKQGLSRHKQ
ncbi:unnamed protein product [Gongylonema pulchrum]|uniref:FERM domain-containing protein n=1 Tax=Gongylonema pulchrum TaxID=637853 RepID=A0A183DJF0_9BILA|nr:unnamed protein product [Gongylonema pulchrum]